MGRNTVEAEQGRPDFGDWLKKTRTSIQPKLTQQDLATKLGYTKQYISNLETNFANNQNKIPTAPDARLLTRLCEAMELTQEQTDAALMRFGFTPKFYSGAGALLIADGTDSRLLGNHSQESILETVQRLRCEARRLQEAASVMQKAASELEEAMRAG